MIKPLKILLHLFHNFHVLLQQLFHLMLNALLLEKLRFFLQHLLQLLHA